MQQSTILQGLFLVLLLCCASLLQAQSSPSTVETLSGLPNDYVPFKYKGVFELFSLTMLSGKDQAFGFIGSETLKIANPTKGTLDTILNLFDNFFYTGTLTVNTITGDYFFADRSIIYVMRVKTGKIERVAGGGSDNSDDIPAIDSNLNRVNSMFFDETTNILYLSQQFNVRKIDFNTGLIFTVCGNGEKKFTGEPMLATDMKLLDPIKVLVSNGEIYITDDFYGRIFKISKDGIISNFAGNGKGKRFVDGDSASGPIDTSNCHNTISKVTGDFFFGCSYGIFKLSKSDQIIHAMTSNNTNAGKVDISTSLNPDDGQLSSNIYISEVQSIIMDNDGIELYFSQFPGRVTRITNSIKSNSKSDWKLQTILGSKTYLVDGIPAIYARTYGPNSAAIVGSQVVFPQQAKYIRQVPLNGIGIIQTPMQTKSDIEVASSVVARYGKNYFYSSACQIIMNPNTVIAGNGVCKFSPDGSSALTSSMNQITFMTISKKGQVFFIEPNAQSFLVRTIINGLFKTIAGGGSDPYSSNIPALNTLLSTPSSLSFSPDEQILYISDNGNNRIKGVYSQNGMLEIIAGNTKANFTNGIPSRNASLDGLSSLTVLPSSGDIILTERNHVRRINSQSGIIYSLFGNMFEWGYTKDGPFDGEKDKMYQPILLDVDPEGTNQLLIQDNYSLRKMISQCKQGNVLSDDWSRCLPCPNGMKSNLDFTRCV